MSRTFRTFKGLLILAALALAALAHGDGLVADPQRSVDVAWPKHAIKGRDYWFLIERGFQTLKGMENEPFVQDSGTAHVGLKCSVRRANPWGFASSNDFYTIGEIRGDAVLKERLKRAPFEVWPPVMLEAGLKVTEKNFDYAGYDRLIEEYGETFLGVRFNEWDSAFLYGLDRYTSYRNKIMSEVMKFPCNRAEMRENIHVWWNAARVRSGRRMTGLSGQTTFEHYGCEWGGATSCVELTSEVPEFPFRNTLMFARGAARQFDVPMYIYTAYFRGPHSPDTRPEHAGEEAGREVSLAWREHLLSYYMGNNIQSFETQAYGFVKKLPSGTHELTINGRELKRLYEWTRSAKGVRGECYTPILFLLDRNHGYDQLSWGGIDEDFGPFKNAFPPSDADFYTEYAMQSIQPRCRAAHGEKNLDNSANLRNSPLGDIFDVYIANPDTPGKELRDDQLAKYSVVMPLGDIVWNNQLVNRIRKYVYEGGTFVMTGSQTAPFKEDVKLGDAVSHRVNKDETSSSATRRDSASPSERDSGIVLSPFGKGHFITVTNPWMKQTKDRWRVPQQMKDLLQKLHDEVVPFKITGDCEFLYNWVPEGAREGTSTTDRSARVSRAGYWKAIILNNAGTKKEGNKPNTPPDPKWTRTVTLELPEGAEVEEVLEGLSPAITSGLPGGQPLPAGSCSSVGSSAADLPSSSPSAVDSPSSSPSAVDSPSSSPSAIDLPSSSPSAVDSPSSSPSAADLPSSSPSAVGADRRAARMKAVSFDIPSGQVIVVNVRGIKNKNSTVQPQPSTSTSSPLTPSSFPDQVYKPHPVYDKCRRDPKAHAYTQSAPATIFAWRNPTGGAAPATTNVEIGAKYYVRTCTIEAEAKADFTKMPNPPHKGVLFFVSEMLSVGLTQDGRWRCTVNSFGAAAQLVGPKATCAWQKLRATFDHGEVRFYVDGVEVTDARGPIRVPTDDCRNGFYECVRIDVGEAHHGWGNYFAGLVKSFRMTTTPDEPCASAPVSFDRAAHSVTFTATATGVEDSSPLEFLFVTPQSDRAYEALFVTDAGAAEIARAFDSAGIPRGRCVDGSACRFRPTGPRLTIEPSLDSLLKEKESPRLSLPLVWTGGTRGADGVPEAETNMPGSVCSLYDCAQSLLTLDDALPQSDVYGRYTARAKFEKGERKTFTVRWDGTSTCEVRRVTFAPGKLKEAFESLKGAAQPIDLEARFDPALTLAEAKAVASALAVIDSRGVRVNGHASGQFFYRAFLPLEKWRDRSERLVQPVEVRLGADGAASYTLVDEDWNVEGNDPKLTARKVSADGLKAFTGDTCFFYAPATMRLSTLFALKKTLPKQIRNWYVYVEGEN